MSAHHSEDVQPLRHWRVEVRQLLLMVLLLTAARASFANHYQVPSSSMENTLFPGDRVAVNMMAYGVRFPFTDTDLIAVDHRTGLRGIGPPASRCRKAPSRRSGRA